MYSRNVVSLAEPIRALGLETPAIATLRVLNIMGFEHTSFEPRTHWAIAESTEFHFRSFGVQYRTLQTGQPNAPSGLGQPISEDRSPLCSASNIKGAKRLARAAL